MYFLDTGYFKMPDKKALFSEEMVELKLKENSKKLGISVDELIIRYIYRGLYNDDHYLEKPDPTREEFIEMGKKAVKRDMENGIPPKKHDFDAFVGRWNKSD